MPFGSEDGYVQMRHKSWAGTRFLISFSGDAEVTGFTVERDADGPAITARSLQRIPYGALERTALDLASSWIVTYAKGLDPAVAENEYLRGTGSGLDLVARAFAEKQYPGAAGRPPAWYAAVASRYAELYRSGSTSPIKDLASEMHLSINKVRNLIYECRERCLLTAPEKKGVAGGRLTDKALDLLRQDDEGSK